MFIVANKSTDMQARLSYALSSDSSIDLTGQLSDYSGGYANFNKQQLELGYRRKLSNLTDMTFGYRYVRNISGMPPDPRWGNTSLTGGDQNYLSNTFLVTLSTQFNSGVGGGGMMGGQSLGNFGGFRAGSGAWGDSSNSYGGGAGGAFQNMSVFGQGSGSGFSSPFGSGGSGFGNSGFGSNGYGNSGYGSNGYGNNGYGVSPSQGYDTFGANFGGGQSGGFNGGLGDISGARNQGGGMGNLAPPPGGQPGQGNLSIEDWYNLDDMYSIWW
jgi:hypothetical protein